ncbi:synaptosomal-associated protein 25-like [Ornithodoros turicata]|uniref:synaptosomal-associated protein 25-like n=1 Tax=Ornithodoros turicata TaxID=34597 RepID=UPI003139B307
MDKQEITELEMLRFKADEKADESLESTRRMLHLCEEAQGVAIKTIIRLDQQGEQLDSVEEQMDRINADLKEAEKNLRTMKRCCGGICPRLPRLRGDKKYPENAWKGEEPDVNVIEDQPGRSAHISDGYVAKITNDDRETEMDDNMGQVSQVIGHLKNLAIDMGTEIQEQNRQLDRLNFKGEYGMQHVHEANQQATNLLKK